MGASAIQVTWTTINHLMRSASSAKIVILAAAKEQFQQERRLKLLVECLAAACVAAWSPSQYSTAGRVLASNATARAFATTVPWIMTKTRMSDASSVQIVMDVVVAVRSAIKL